MFIYRIKIQNFRVLKDFEWKPNKGINVIIGPNGCGKSTLAVALDFLLNPYQQWYNRTLSEMDYFDRNINNPVLIEVWFKDVEDFIEDDEELYLEHITENDEISEEGQEIVLIVRLKAGVDRKVSHSIYSNGKESPFRQSHKGAVNFKYIESDRDPLKALSFVNNSILSKLLNDESLGGSIQEVINNFNRDASSVLMGNSYFKETIENLGDNFSGFDLLTNSEAAVGIEATELTDKRTLQAFSLVFKNKKLSSFIPIKYQSRGIKNLMLLIALQENMKNSGILFLEEPEQNLEPFMQRKIVQQVCSSCNGQLFFSTHSVEITKMFNFDDIFLMREAIIKKIIQPKEIDKSFETRIEKFAKQELISGLFSKGILLVEGDSELSGLPLYSHETDIGLENSGVEIIKGDGKDRLCQYAQFYSEAI